LLRTDHSGGGQLRDTPTVVSSKDDLMQLTKLTVAIPTFQREAVLVQTIRYLLDIWLDGLEIMIVDQTPKHEPEVLAALSAWHEGGKIRWLRSDVPSITQAMNRALIEAKGEIVLFLDDDLIPDPELFKSHLAAHRQQKAPLIAGRVLQPWQEGQDFSTDEHFHFATLRPRYIDKFMGGNFSIDRQKALEIGGFDENFVRVAYNFELEFAHRFLAAGHRIYYEPAALIHHLKISLGGTRSYGHHLTTAKPDHAVGAHYFILRTRAGVPRIRDIVIRFLQSIATRHHMKKPWMIFPTLLAELRGFFWALRLEGEGPRFIRLSHD
jgi:GT2 family glycosyltransferase